MINTHKLQPPFDDVVVYGDILLNRSDENGCPLDFTKGVTLLSLASSVIIKFT